MVKIVIENLAKKELFTNDLTLSALQLIHGHFIDWMHACGGKGRCTSCKMMVLSGKENISPPTEAEKKYRQEGSLGIDERLACQSFISGDVVICVPDENKLPHVQYTS